MSKTRSMLATNGPDKNLALHVMSGNHGALPSTISVTVAESAVGTTTAVIVSNIVSEVGKINISYVTVTGSVHGAGVVTLHLAIGVVSNLVCVIGTVTPV